MINEVMTGISRTLDTIFNADGGENAIYSEKIEQGLKVPCFIISLVDAAKMPLLNVRSKQTYSFDVKYISKNGTKAEMLSAADKLFFGLKFITLLNGDKLMGFNMRYEIVDDVLHFFVEYPVTMREVEEIDTMENYELSQKVER